MIIFPILFLISIAATIVVDSPAPVGRAPTTEEIVEHEKKVRESFPGETK